MTKEQKQLNEKKVLKYIKGELKAAAIYKKQSIKDDDYGAEERAYGIEIALNSLKAIIGLGYLD